MNELLRFQKVSKTLLLINIGVTVAYLSWWFVPQHIGNPLLYGLLLFGEIYHVIMAFTFWHTIWPRNKPRFTLRPISEVAPTVDIYIPTVNEPMDVIRQTIEAAKAIRYPYKKIYLLNDGYVAGNETWQEAERVALQEGVICITRRVGGGHKAGNINNALRETHGEIIVIFDADMQAHPDFLEKTIPYFQKESTGFVQTPQYYSNAGHNLVTAGAWEQQVVFFGPIMEAKGRMNAAFICGTNVAIRRKALNSVGGMAENNITEDLLTSVYVHQKHWKSYYLQEILAEGLAPQDLASYYTQQMRWARGGLEILFKENPLFKRGLNIHQRIEYFSSALYYFNGIIVLIDMMMPILFLFFGFKPVVANTTSFAIYFLPYIILNLYTLFLASDGTITFRAISFSQASWALQTAALFSVLTGMKMSFKVTSKDEIKGNFISLVVPHLGYILLVAISVILSIHREGLNPSVITNIAWAVFNIALFLPFIQAAINLKPAIKLKILKIQSLSQG